MGCSNSTSASQPVVRSAPPKVYPHLLSPAANRAKGVKKTAYRIEGFVPCSKFLKGFKLKEGDEVIVYPDLATLKQSCDEGDVGWDDDKEKYIASLSPQDVGTVGKRDIVGKGRRVHWPDKHWWSFAPDVLAVRLTSLDANQRQFLIDDSENHVIWNTKSRAALQAAAVVVPAVASVVPTVISSIPGSAKRAKRAKKKAARGEREDPAQEPEPEEDEDDEEDEDEHDEEEIEEEEEEEEEEDEEDEEDDEESEEE